MTHATWQSAFGTVLLLIVGPVRSEARVVREEIRGPVTARAVFDGDKTTLSGDITLSLTVEGPERVEVVPPRPLLTKSSAQSWRVREVDLPLVENLENGRQRWKQEFLLSPYVAGPKVEIEFAPLRVKAGSALQTEITWSRSFEVEVTTSIVQADSQSLRPITDIEPAPAATPADPHVLRRWLIVGAVALGALATLAFVFILAFRGGKREDGIVHDAAWALRELATVERVVGFAKLAEIVRLYLECDFQIPAPRLTTAELLELLMEPRHIAPLAADELRAILERCDIAKFVDGGANASDCAEWIERTEHFIRSTSSVETTNGATLRSE